MKRLVRNFPVLTLMLASLTLAACAEDEDDGGDEDINVSEMITAAAGGTVEGGGASLDIPANALAADTTITLVTSDPSGVPDVATVKGKVFDFGPDGTTFDPAAQLTMPTTGTPGENEKFVISWLDEENNVWVDINGTVAGTTVSAPVSHFTKFVVRIIPGGGSGEQCMFSTCGGDLVGSWTIASACILSGEESISECPSAEVTLELDQDGTVEFEAGGDYSTSFMNNGATMTAVLPASCMGEYENPASCTALGTHLSEGTVVTCTGDVAVSCTCTMVFDGDEAPDTESGTYTTDGNTVTLTPSGENETPETLDYCVEGNTLTVQSTEDGEDPTISVITLTK